MNSQSTPSQVSAAPEDMLNRLYYIRNILDGLSWFSSPKLRDLMISGRDAVKAAVESLGYAYEESGRLSVPVALERPEATGRGHREATTGPDTGKRIRDVIQRHRYNVTDSKWEDLSPAQQSGWAELERHFIASLGVASKVREEN